MSGRAAGRSCLESARKAEGQSESAKKRARRGPGRSCEKALVKKNMWRERTWLSLVREAARGESGTRGRAGGVHVARKARAHEARETPSGQAEGRREKGSRDSLFFSISFHLFYVQVRVKGACRG